jgi:hypothetical protein
MGEAQFFYWKLMAAGKRTSAEPPEAFGYYLSAFLCAARSVAEIAQYDLRKRRLVSSWEQTLSAEDRVFLCLLSSSRDTEVHRSGVKVKRQPFEFLEDSFPDLQRALQLVPERFLVVGDKQYGVLALCDRYLALNADMLEHIDATLKVRPVNRGHTRPK